MSRKYRPHKRRRPQAVTSVEEPDGQNDANDEQHAEITDSMDVDGPNPNQSAVEDEPPVEPPQEQEPDEELKRKQEIWEAFQEEHHEGTLS